MSDIRSQSRVCPAPETKLPNSCTPHSDKIASIHNQTITGTNGVKLRAFAPNADVVEKRLERELEHATSRGLKDLTETMFNKLYTPSKIIEEDEFCKIIDRLVCDPRLRTSEGWKMWPSNQASIREDVFKNMVAGIETIAAEYLPPSPYGYTDMFHGTEIVDEKYGTSYQPDLVMLLKMWLSKSNDVRWSHPKVVGEVKPKKQLKKAVNQLSRYVLGIFAAQPNRRYVIGITVVGSRVTLWVFDRSGAISSKPINVHKQPELFLRLILGTLYANDQTLGYDPTIYTKDGSNDKYMTVGGVEYKLKEIYTERTIRGRGTICYQGEVKVENVSKFVAIKDSWVDVCRDETEPQILEHLNSGPEESLCTPDGVRVIPKMIHHEIVKIKVTNDKGIEEEVDDTTAILRAKVVKGNPQFVIADAVKKAGTKTEPKKYEIRAHSRIVTEPFGKEIQMFRSLRGLIRAFCDIFYAIQILFEKGVLHRDISMRNVLLHEHNGELRGLLIDYDHSVFIDKESTNAIADRTGTLPFMALDRLSDDPKFAHSYFHDLESMLYLICWICAMYAGPENRKRRFANYYENRVGFWNGRMGQPATMDNVWSAKKKTVYEERDFMKTLLHLAPYFKPLVPSLIDMRCLIFDPPMFNKYFGRLLSDIKKSLDERLNCIQDVGDNVALAALAKEYHLQVPIQWRPAKFVFQSFQDTMEDALRNIPEDHEQGEETRQSEEGDVSNAVLLRVRDARLEVQAVVVVPKPAKDDSSGLFDLRTDDDEESGGEENSEGDGEKEEAEGDGDEDDEDDDGEDDDGGKEVRSEDVSLPAPGAPGISSSVRSNASLGKRKAMEEEMPTSDSKRSRSQARAGKCKPKSTPKSTGGTDCKRNIRKKK